MNKAYSNKAEIIGDNLSVHLNERIIVTDMDEVLINISFKWYQLIRKDWDYFKEYFKDYGELNEPEVLQRNIYILSDWLKKDEIEKLPEEVIERFMNLYEDTDFYDLDFNQLTPMGNGIIAMAKESYVKKIYIISRTTSNRTAQYKARLFKKVFARADDKIEMILVPNNVSKSSIINDNKINYTTYIEDNLNEIEDVVLNTNVLLKEIMIPVLGYNNIQTKPDVVRILEKNMCKINPYYNFSVDYTYKK